MRHAFPIGFAFLLAASSAVAKTPPAKGPEKTAGVGATLTPIEPTISTGADFAWTVNLQITNTADVGLYMDSLSCRVEDLDPGESRGERVSHADLRRLVQLVPSIPALENNVIQHSGPATAEHARLDYRMYCHRADGKKFMLDASVEAVPGASREYESKFLEVDGKKVEYVIVPALGGSVSSAGILVVHGHGNHARHMIHFARTLANRGNTVALLSMPGYGQSEGPAELMGPTSVRAADMLLDMLKRQDGVDSTRMGAWGLSRGATVVAELATLRKDLGAIVLQSGIYDLWATYRDTKLAGFRETIVAEAGKDSAAWAERSPLLHAGDITAATLILHGDLDPQVPAAPAHALAAALEARGIAIETRFLPKGEHQFPTGEAMRSAMAFLAKRLAKDTQH